MNKQQISRAVRRVKARLTSDRPRPEPSAANLDGRVGFAVGTGRCGTHFLARLLEHEPAVHASHERDPLLETFHRYCKWHALPVDSEGFLHAMEAHIRGDLSTHQLSFESSCHLSLSVTELDARFRAKMVLLIRDPYQTVKSHLGKGWYDRPVIQRDPALALGYQSEARFHHFLGRLTPRGAELERWNQRTRVGKLSWFWATLNQAVLDQAADLPDTRWRVIRLEDFDYRCYRELADFLGFAPRVTAKQFAAISEARPGRGKRNGASWTTQEWDEFSSFVTPLAARFGYELRPTAAD